VLKSEVLKPAKAPVTVFVFAITAMVRPEPIPANSPTMSASFLNLATGPCKVRVTTFDPEKSTEISPEQLSGRRIPCDAEFTLA